MQTIGNIDNEKSMFEQIDEYGVCGYNVKDLKPEDKEFVRGMAWMIDVADQYKPFICTGSDEMDKIAEELFEDVLKDLVVGMLSELGMMLYSIMDNDEDYWEVWKEDEEE